MPRLTEEELVIFTEKAVVIEEGHNIFGHEIKIIAYIEAIPRQQGDAPLPGTIGTLPPMHPQLAAREPEEVNDAAKDKDE